VGKYDKDILRGVPCVRLCQVIFPVPDLGME
jgi:hypothetical protein